MTALSKAAKVVFINLAVLVLLLMLVEGGASLLFVANEMRHTPGVDEQRHADYDETLGWVNRPNVHLPDLYGQGVDLRTNAQGFRSDRDFPRAVPPGKTRVICSGDSFTLGFGVSNAQAWCERISAVDPRFETVNMGQGGYGLDQAYLWYMRDGRALEHQLHVFAFITDDFVRMQSDRFMGYGKPRLALRNDSVVVTNRPVPRTSAFTRWMAIHGPTLEKLNMVRLVRKLVGRDAAPGAPGSSAADAETRAIIARMFEELERANQDKGSRLVLVYLPTEWDYRNNARTDAWREFVRAESARQGIALIDLVEQVRQVPPTEVGELFASNAHYSVAGNEFVAVAVRRALAAMIPRQATNGGSP